MELLFDSPTAKNIMFNDLGSGLMVQSNQHVIIKGDEACVLDPGGHKVYTQLFAQLSPVVPISHVKHLFFSHQDPDIVAAANGWLMVSDATAHISEIWIRFITHFGIDSYVEKRIKGLPDSGGRITLGGKELLIIPAHFLHSSGNFHLFDPETGIYYSGDLGASMGNPYTYVERFEDHVQYIEGFHKRYLPSARPVQLLLDSIRDLDIKVFAPQHGAIYRGSEVIGGLFDYLSGLHCGFEAMSDVYRIP